MTTKAPIEMHNILALWTHPRSRSTAFERVMMERGDLTVLHEPFSYVYYVHEGRATLNQEYVDPAHPTTYEGIRAHIVGAGEQGPVFFKDMSLHCWSHLQNDQAFINRLTNTFLIREPKSAIASYYALHPEVSCEEIGYEQLWQLFVRVQEVTHRTPIVIDADDVVANPAGILRAYCEAVGLPFLPHALQWEAGHQTAWDIWQRWHVDAAQSTGLRPQANTYAVSVDQNAHLRTYYDYHLPFYEALKQHCIRA